MKKITILECAYGLGVGGMERAMQEFAINIDKSKYRVLVGAYDISGPRRKILEKHGITVVRIDREKIDELIDTYDIDVVHSHGVHLDDFYGKVKIFREVVFWGDFDTKADMNVVISKTLYLKYKNVKEAKLGKNICVLYYPQNVQRWKQLRPSPKVVGEYRKKLGFSTKDVIFGRLGRSEISKTDFLLLASLNKMCRANKNIKFLFVGLPRLFKWYIALNPSIRRRVVYLPQTADDKHIAKFYATIDVFWHTASRGETFGNVNAEAMIFEKPVLTHSTPFDLKNWKTTDNAQIEIVDHNHTGLVASYPSDVAYAANLLAGDKGKRSVFGKNGAQKVKKVYDAKVIAKHFDALVASVVKNEARHPINPSGAHIEQYVQSEYPHRLKNVISVSRSLEKSLFNIRRQVFAGISWIYLVIRYILRTYCGVDLEKKS